MKATGIVRRIDDLGRVVIPKEIRRTMRIREGDPLEIFTDNDGEVVFKKYSPVGEMTPFALQYADVMSRACGLPVLIWRPATTWWPPPGCRKKSSWSAASRPAGRADGAAPHPHRQGPGDQHRVQPVEGIERYAAVAIPILAAGDVTRRGVPHHAGERRRTRRRRRQADPGGRRLPGPSDGGIKGLSAKLFPSGRFPKGGACLIFLSFSTMRAIYQWIRRGRHKHSSFL